MSLNPLRIALSGFGGAVLSIALSGFVVESDAPPAPPIALIDTSQGGGHHKHRAAPSQTRAELEQRLREDDEAVVLAIVAFVIGDSG